MVTLPLEIVAAAITIQYWNSPISPALWVTIFLVLILAINLLGVKGYGEAEFYMALVKVVAIIGFMQVFPLLQFLKSNKGPQHPRYCPRLRWWPSRWLYWRKILSRSWGI